MVTVYGESRCNAGTAWSASTAHPRDGLLSFVLQRSPVGRLGDARDRVPSGRSQRATLTDGEGARHRSVMKDVNLRRNSVQNSVAVAEGVEHRVGQPAVRIIEAGRSIIYQTHAVFAGQGELREAPVEVVPTALDEGENLVKQDASPARSATPAAPEPRRTARLRDSTELLRTQLSIVRTGNPAAAAAPEMDIRSLRSLMTSPLAIGTSGLGKR